MKRLITRNPFRAAGWLTLLLLAPMLIALYGCTDLGEETFGIVTPDQFYQTDEEILAAVAPIYAQLRATLWAYHNLSQVSSDETIVPTRGSDWFDNGRWLAMHRHTWDPSLVDLNDAWVAALTGVARANGLLQQLQDIETSGKDELVAEIRTLRAFYYYQLLDLFGNVPIVGDDEFTVDPDNPPATESRQAVYDFLVTELQEARGSLPATRPEGELGRVTQGAADAMLANLYLNASVFTKTSSDLGAGTPHPCTEAGTCQDAVATVDRILNSGNYSLASNWFDNFAVDNANSPEFIFMVQYINQPGLGMNFPQRALHYNQLTPSPWNGFSTLASVFNSFDENDARREIFLVGRAINYNTGEEVDNRQGEPLIFTPEIQDPTDATEGEGVRILKFPPDPDNAGGDGHNNDYAFFRLAEMLLIKAEALNEMNGPNQQSIDLINQLRARVFDPDEPIALADFPTKEALRERIFQERLFELTYEAKRRQDLIRAGQFTASWEFKEVSGDSKVQLFPIPQTQLDANPNLVQNPGY